MKKQNKSKLEQSQEVMPEKRCNVCGLGYLYSLEETWNRDGSKTCRHDGDVPRVPHNRADLREIERIQNRARRDEIRLNK